MSSCRCPVCLINWPQGSDYKTCPECGEMTRYSSSTAIDRTEAKSRKRHADFERWLDDNGRRDPVELLERQLAV